MISTDTLTCQVTPNSVEPDSLSCSMPPLDNLDLWATLGSLGTTGATVLLAIFAFVAWRSSQATLRTMERQLEDNRTAAQNAIEADKDLAIETRQRALLADYCVAITDLGTYVPLKNLSHAEELNYSLKQNLTAASAWVSWAMELHRSDPQFRSLTSTWDHALRTEITVNSLTGLGIKPAELESLLTVKGQALDISKFVGWYLRQLQTWQVEPSRRQEVAASLLKSQGQYIV